MSDLERSNGKLWLIIDGSNLSFTEIIVDFSILLFKHSILLEELYQVGHVRWQNLPAERWKVCSLSKLEQQWLQLVEYLLPFILLVLIVRNVFDFLDTFGACHLFSDVFPGVSVERVSLLEDAAASRWYVWCVFKLRNQVEDPQNPNYSVFPVTNSQEIDPFLLDAAQVSSLISNMLYLKLDLLKVLFSGFQLHRQNVELFTLSFKLVKQLVYLILVILMII